MSEEKVRKPRKSDDELCEIIKKSASVNEVMKAVYKNRAGAESYLRVARLMKQRKLKFTNGNVYYNEKVAQRENK